MANQLNRTKGIWVLLPVFGTLLYVVLFIIAAALYPGGSQVDKNSKGFSWLHNYWCNLLNDQAINGAHNTARPVGLFAMVVLCITLSIFWYIFPQYMGFGKTARRIIQYSGILSMAIGLLLFSSLHDIVIVIAGFFGLIAVTGTFIGLYKNKWYKLFLHGMLCLVLILLNNYIYYISEQFLYLPVIQRISFFVFLLWICLIDINLYRKIMGYDSR